MSHSIDAALGGSVVFPLVFRLLAVQVVLGCLSPRHELVDSRWAQQLDLFGSHFSTVFRQPSSSSTSFNLSLSLFLAIQWKQNQDT